MPLPFARSPILLPGAESRNHGGERSGSGARTTSFGEAPGLLVISTTSLLGGQVKGCFAEALSVGEGRSGTRRIEVPGEVEENCAMIKYALLSKKKHSVHGNMTST